MLKHPFRSLWIIFFAFLVFAAPARASGTWFTLLDSETAQPAAAGSSCFTGEIRMTFLGDCTLGGLESKQRSALGFVRRIEENGLDFPFRHLKALTAEDDLTVANLEGVLSDRKLKKVPKKYNFIGPAAYTGILTSGSIECATLANNHSRDYGEDGFADTVSALESAGIAWFDTDAPAVWENADGLRIGFLGVSYSLTGDRYKRFAAQAQRLKNLGCAAIVAVMHAGTEYSYSPPDRFQAQIVQRAVKCGSCLVIGHHPHVVQGVDLVDGVPVVYSLGNCSFGGTTHAKDSDALAVRAVFSFEESALKELDLHFYPVSITSDARYNNYSPCLLSGADALRVLAKMKKSTGVDTGTWDEKEGAVLSFRINRPFISDK